MNRLMNRLGRSAQRLVPLLSLGTILLLAGLLLPGAAWAADRGTPEEAKAMAIKAAAYLKSVGPEKAFPEFDAGGPWLDRDLYVTVQNNAGIMLARGNNPGLIGKSLIDLRDVDGKPFVREVSAITDAGWVTLKWQNPVTKAVEPKTMYAVRVGDYLVGVGAYVK